MMGWILSGISPSGEFQFADRSATLADRNLAEGRHQFLHEFMVDHDRR